MILRTVLARTLASRNDLLPLFEIERAVAIRVVAVEEGRLAAVHPVELRRARNLAPAQPAVSVRVDRGERLTTLQIGLRPLGQLLRAPLVRRQRRRPGVLPHHNLVLLLVRRAGVAHLLCCVLVFAANARTMMCLSWVVVFPESRMIRAIVES